MRRILFSEFEVEAKGFFFTESPAEALEFGNNIAECYINLTNPLLDPRRDRHLAIDRLSYNKEIELMKILSPLIYKDGNEFYFDVGIRKIPIRSRYYEFAHQWIYEAINNGGLEWDCLDNPKVVEIMKSFNYDGTFVQESEAKIGRSIFVISPEQVKINKWLREDNINFNKDDFYTKKIDGRDILHGTDGAIE